jgi:hypothetical protein
MLSKVPQPFLGLNGRSIYHSRLTAAQATYGGDSGLGEVLPPEMNNVDALACGVSCSLQLNSQDYSIRPLAQMVLEELVFGAATRGACL